VGDRLPVRDDPQPIGRDSSGRAVVERRLVQLVNELREQDPLVRAEVPDAVHAMRVTTRQLRSALSTFRPLLDRRITEPLRDDLTWLAAALGVARDAEVLRSRLLGELEAHGAEVERVGLSDFLERDLGDRYRLAHRRCVEAMRTGRYLGLLERLQELALSPPWAERETAGDQAVLRRRVRKDWKRLRRAVRALEADGEGGDPATRLHEVRKVAKRVRYGAETLIPPVGTRAEKLAKAVKEVQRVLGDHQDGALSRAVLFDLSVRATAQGQNAFALGVLSAREEDHARAARAAFDAVWKKASRARLRRWLS
jgi:CHAD domain-containing protein